MKRLLISSLFGCMLMSQTQMCMTSEMEDRLANGAFGLAAGMALSMIVFRHFEPRNLSQLCKKKLLETTNKNNLELSLNTGFKIASQGQSETDKLLLAENYYRPVRLLRTVTCISGVLGLSLALKKENITKQMFGIGMATVAFICLIGSSVCYDLRLPTQNLQ